MKKSKTCSGTQAQIKHTQTLAHGYDLRIKEGSLYLSRVFVLTIRHLQHSVYLYIVGVKGLLFHLRAGKGKERERKKERTNP